MSAEPLLVYKVLTADQVEALEDGAFAGSPADVEDGFIHLSTAAQLDRTLAVHFEGQTGLWIAAVDVAAAGPALRWEESRDGALFPHLYAALTLDEVIAYGPLECEPDGAIRLPVAG